MRRYVIVALLALAALLTACGGDGAQTARAGSYTVTLRMDEAAVGQRTAVIEVKDAQGQPAAVDSVVVAPVMRDMGMASPEIAAAPDGPGRYTAGAIEITMVGQWELDVRISAGGAEETATFIIRVT